MTDTLLEQIKADAEKGTPGPWEVRYERGCTHLYMLDQSQMCDETYYPWVPENLSDWERIARVPEMEARILADAEEKAALREALSRIARDTRNCAGDSDSLAFCVLSTEAAARAALIGIGDSDE